MFIFFDLLLHFCWRPSSNFKSKLFIFGIVIQFFFLFLFFYFRLSVMNFSAPKFSTMDNPSYHIENIFYRYLNFSYTYILNVFILLCPIWLCFDWSMGCIELIDSFLDLRFVFVISFYSFSFAFILKTFSSKAFK